MEWIFLGLAALLALAQWRGWIDLTGTHGSTGGSDAFGAIDEVFAPHRHEIQAQRDIDHQLAVPGPESPDLVEGQGDRAQRPGAYSGTFRLDL